MSLDRIHSLLLTPFSSTIGIALANGGTAGLFWNYIIGAVGLGFVYASIAEMGSMSVSIPRSYHVNLPTASRFPTSGGQYYWVAILAPRKARRYLSYITGELFPFLLSRPSYLLAYRMALRHYMADWPRWWFLFLRNSYSRSLCVKHRVLCLQAMAWISSDACVDLDRCPFQYPSC